MEIHNQKKPPSCNFFIIPNCIFKERLKARDLAVYCYLMYCADRVTFDCYPARKTIAQACGMSPPTVDEATKVLVEKGLINVSHRFDSNGNRTPIFPTKETKSGIRYNARVWADIDLLLTCDTIKEASEKSKERKR